MIKLEKQLEEYAEAFLQHEYNLDLEIPIKINGRLSRSLGRFKYNMNGAIVIEIAKRMVEHYTVDEILDTLKHELVHYALFKLGKPHRDGHHVFENELKKLGISSTNTKRYKGKAHVYKCSQCNNTFTKNRRLGKRYMFRCECGTNVYESDHFEITMIM